MPIRSLPIRSLLAAAALSLTATAAPAQDLGSLLGGATKGGLIPGLGSAGVGNAAGLLGYCLKNKFLGSGAGLAGVTGATGTTGGAAGVLSRLTGRPEVKSSPGYLLGQQGKVEQPGGGGLSLGGLSGQLKTRACDLVLKRAGSFL